METVICPKCHRTNTGTTTLYNCQHCGQSLSGVPRSATQSAIPDTSFKEGYMTHGGGFFAALFDVSFSEFITTKLIKVLYIISMIALVILQIIVIREVFNQSKGVGVLYLILSPFIFLLSVILVRIWLEMLIVIFRIADHTRDIAQQRQ